jgi:arsenate reductase
VVLLPFIFSIGRHHGGGRQIGEIVRFTPSTMRFIGGIASFSWVPYGLGENPEMTMEVTFYGLKSCDTCRKAIKTIQDLSHCVTYVDVRACGIGAGKLAEFQDEFGKSLINTRSTTWRNLSEHERARPALQLLADHPTLMKRPVIVAGSTMFLGWGKAVQNAFLKL